MTQFNYKRFSLSLFADFLSVSHNLKIRAKKDTHIVEKWFKSDGFTARKEVKSFINYRQKFLNAENNYNKIKLLQKYKYNLKKK
jgi:hypothetical protein